MDVAGWSKGFIGMLGSISYIFAALFVVIFASSLKHVRFRKILIVLQICSALLSALDLVLVCVAKDALWVRRPPMRLMRPLLLTSARRGRIRLLPPCAADAAGCARAVLVPSRPGRATSSRSATGRRVRRRRV